MGKKKAWPRRPVGRGEGNSAPTARWPPLDDYRRPAPRVVAGLCASLWPRSWVGWSDCNCVSRGGRARYSTLFFCMAPHVWYIDGLMELLFGMLKSHPSDSKSELDESLFFSFFSGLPPHHLFLSFFSAWLRPNQPQICSVENARVGIYTHVLRHF